jgi:hypothetical protein
MDVILNTSSKILLVILHTIVVLIFASDADPLKVKSFLGRNVAHSITQARNFQSNILLPSSWMKYEGENDG